MTRDKTRFEQRVKPNKQIPHENPPPRRAPPAQDSARPMSKRRQWLYRFGAMLFIPLLVLGGLELALRLTGYGYPVSFFLRSSISGHDYYVTNEKFGYRFFPPAL